MSISTWVAYSGVSSISWSTVYHAVAARKCSSTRSGSNLLRLGEEADLGAEPHDRVLVALDHGARDLHLELDRAGRHPLEQAEVEERDAAVGEQHRVAGVRVARELVVAVHAAEVEAEQDLADAVALRLRVALDLLEADALDELGDEHALARERRDHVGHEDERVAAVDPRERALVLGLELVVELLLDPVPDLLADRLGVEPRRDPLGQPQDHAEVLQVGAHRRRDPRVLDLDRDVAAVVQPRTVDLPDRRGRDRLLVELLEDLIETGRRAPARSPCASP